MVTNSFFIPVGGNAVGTTYDPNFWEKGDQIDGAFNTRKTGKWKKARTVTESLQEAATRIFKQQNCEALLGQTMGSNYRFWVCSRKKEQEANVVAILAALVDSTIRFSILLTPGEKKSCLFSEEGTDHVQSGQLKAGEQTYNVYVYPLEEGRFLQVNSLLSDQNFNDGEQVGGFVTHDITEVVKKGADAKSFCKTNKINADQAPLIQAAVAKVKELYNFPG